MLAGKKLYVLIAAALSMAAGGVGYSYVQHEKKQESFFGDGYVLTVDETAGETTAAPVYFNAGTRYKVSYPDQVTFKTTDGKKTQLDYTNFVHYADGSIGAVTDGVLMELEQLKNGYINYYNVSSKSIMKKDGDKYILDNQGQELEFKDFVWKLSDSKYLVSSDALDVVLPNKSNLDTDGFVELNYLDDGIVQILTDDAAYQVLTAGTTVELSNGMQIDTDSREIQNGDEKLMSLSSLEVDGATNISVVPSENQAAMTVPKFNITTIDGVDGESGASGEEGQAGENGENGEEGQAGENGENGEQGNTGENGNDGDKGRNGSSGSDGSSGRSGSAGKAGQNGNNGSNGANGSGGNTGGTAGGGSGSGSGGTSTSGTVMPVVRVEEFQYDSGSVSGKLSVEEGNGVTLGTGILWITDVQTGKKVQMDTFDLEEAVEINFDSSRLAGSGFHIEAGKEYQVSLEASYTLDRTDSAGNQITGTTNLFMRTFSTNKLGISESYDHATTSEIYVKVEKAEYSTVKDFKLVYQSVGGEEPESEISKTFDANSRSMDLTLDHDTGLNPDTTYKVKLYAKNPEATDAANLWELISTHSYKTLKRAPSIGGKPIVALSPRGYFEIKPGVGVSDSGELNEISDPDNGIRKYRYEIYTADGNTLVTSVESSTFDPVSVYVDGTNVCYNKNYKAKLVVEFYDNEKTVEYATEFSETFMLDSENTAPFMMFQKADTISDPTDPREGTETVRSESIQGNLQFHFNHADLNISQSNPLTFEISSEAFIKEKTIYQIFENPNAQQDILSIPVDIKGLRANTTYRFNAYGTYRGDTASTLLATCIVTTKKTSPLTIHMQEMHLDTHALSVKMYFTDEKGEATKAPLEAYTMYQIKLGLYEGINKVGSADIRFARENDNNKEYSGEAATKYFSADGSDYLLVTNETFNLGASNINNSSGNFEMVVEGGVAYDYTATDDLRFKDENDSPLGSYSNEIPLNGDTSVKLKPTEVAPEIPEEGMKVTAITNENAGDFGFSYNNNLPGSAMIGFILTPQYDNTSGYAKWADYYIYDRYEYESYIAGLGPDDAKNDPLANSGKLGKNKTEPLLHYKYELSKDEMSSEDGLLPRLIVMIGEDPNPTQADHYTVQKEGDYKGMRYIYADTHNAALKAGGTAERVERGREFYFPYDVNLYLNDGDYRYPYQYNVNGGGTGSYVHADQIMKNNTPVRAERAEPVIEMYPYEINNSQRKSQWNMKINDPDGALTLDSFYSRNESGTESVSDFKNLPTRDGIGGDYFEADGDGQTFLLKKYLSALYTGDNKWLLVDFKPADNTGDDTTVALRMKYNALYDGKRNGESGEKDLTSYVFRKDRVPDFIAAIYYRDSAAGTTPAEKEQATIEADNAITFVLQTKEGQSDSMEGVTAIFANVSGGGKQKTYYLSYSSPTTTADGFRQYRAVLPLSTIKEFMGQTLTISLQAAYENGSYGYKEELRPSAKNNLFAIMTGNGNYLVENTTQDALDSVSTKAGSIYEISDFNLTENRQKKRTVTFSYRGFLQGRSGKATMESTETGYKLGDNQDMVFRPLTLSKAITVSSAAGSITFNTMKPTISKTTVQAGLTSAQFNFDLTDHVEELLQDNTNVLVKIFKRADDASDASGDTLAKTIEIPLAELKTYLEDSKISQTSYTMKINGLEKDTRYFIEVSGTLKGSSTSVPFLDTAGANNYTEFRTLDALKGTAYGSTISLPSYQDKMLYGRFGLNTVVGIVLRYDVYEFDNVAWMPADYSQEDMEEKYLEGGRLIYTQKDLKDNEMFKVLPKIYTTQSNLLALSLWPQGTTENGGNKASLFKAGKYYNIRIRAYQEGTDVNVDEMPESAELLGDFFMSRYHLQYRSNPDPVARVTAQFASNMKDLTQQNATLTIAVSDNGRSLVSDYFGTYEWGTDGGAHVTEIKDRDGNIYDHNGKDEVENYRLYGAYMVRLYEAQYNEVAGIRTRTGWDLLDDSYFENNHDYNGSWVGRNFQSIALQKLKQDTEYRVVVYGAVDSDMSGDTKEINQEMLETFLNAQTGSSVQNDTKVQVISDTIIHTLDSSGIYVSDDKLEVEQTSDSEIAVYMYNSAGLDRVKYVEYNFVQEDINADGSFDTFYTGLLPAEGDRVTQTREAGTTGNVTDTWTLKDMSFNAKGRYRVVIRFYGADEDGNPSAEPIFSTTKYFRVTSIPVSETASSTPKARPSVLAAQMLPVEDRKKFRIG